MLTLRHLQVRGFRGFVAERRFEFGGGLTLLFGPNAAGKSSTVNAIEWCLFGDQCKGKQTSIRERIGWEVANRAQKPADVQVELRLVDQAGEWTIRRCIGKPAGKRTLVETLTLIGPDGVALADDDAEARLARLLGCTFRDFMTTVHQHQEAIRDALTREPRERDDAIDRLLGLSEYRNLQGAIQSVNAKGWLKELGRRLDSLEERVRTALRQRANDLDAKRKEAAEAGVLADQLSPESALRGAGEAAQMLADFVKEAGLATAVPPPPAIWSGLRDFERQLQDLVARLRTELPDAREEAALLARRRQVEAALQDATAGRERLDQARQALQQLAERHGSPEQLAAVLRETAEELARQKDRLKQANRKAALLREAVDFLQTNAPEPRCPLCEHEAPDLLAQVRQRLGEALVKQQADIDERIRMLDRQMRDQQQADREYRAAQETVRRLEADQTRLLQRLGELFSNESMPGDASAMVDRLQAERRRIDERLAELGRLVKEKQTRLNAVSGRIERVRVIREYLQVEARKGQVMAIKQAPEFQELEKLRDQASRLYDDLERIKEAVAWAAQEEAQQRLTAARQHINDYFRRLSQHPAITEIQVTLTSDCRSGRNSYELTDAEGRDLVPVLSQGDMNALALAIFLGLAASGAGAFGFVMLDDPSQSLGSGHKVRLAELLTELAGKRQVVVATMDEEFRQALARGPLTEYRFAGWTPAGVAIGEAS